MRLRVRIASSRPILQLIKDDKMFKVVGVLQPGVVVYEEFKLLREAMAFVADDHFNRLHIRRPNGTWVKRK